MAFPPPASLASGTLPLPLMPYTIKLARFEESSLLVEVPHVSSCSPSASKFTKFDGHSTDPQTTALEATARLTAPDRARQHSLRWADPGDGGGPRRCGSPSRSSGGLDGEG